MIDYCEAVVLLCVFLFAGSHMWELVVCCNIFVGPRIFNACIFVISCDLSRAIF